MGSRTVVSHTVLLLGVFFANAHTFGADEVSSSKKTVETTETHTSGFEVGGEVGFSAGLKGIVKGVFQGKITGGYKNYTTTQTKTTVEEIQGASKANNTAKDQARDKARDKEARANEARERQKGCMSEKGAIEKAMNDAERGSSDINDAGGKSNSGSGSSSGCPGRDCNPL